MKDVAGKIIASLIGAMVAIVSLFIGPFRNMASQTDIKDFITKNDIPINYYNEDRNMILKYMKDTEDSIKNLYPKIDNLNNRLIIIETKLNKK